MPLKVWHENQRIESVSRYFCEFTKLLDLLVDLIGIEPMTSSMPWKRAPSCATGPLPEKYWEGLLYLQGYGDIRQCELRL